MQFPFHERSHREIPLRDEVGELRKTRRSEANLREEAYLDVVSQEGQNILDTELLERQSTLNKLTKQMRELQEGIISLSESQDFKDLETVSSSGSTHAPSKPSVFPSFFHFALPRPVLPV